MSKHLIICIESQKNSDIDKMYVDKVINYIYIINNDVVLTYIEMSGKGNYNKPNIINKINKYLRMSTKNEKYVIYCIDTDNYDTDFSVSEQNNKIEQYCKDNDYKYIWFCKNVEDVFWHETVSNSNKMVYAKRFNSQNSLQKASLDSLNNNRYSKQKSNILKVLDNILDRK